MQAYNSIWCRLLVTLYPQGWWIFFYYPSPTAKSHPLHTGSMDFINFSLGLKAYFLWVEVSKGNFVSFLQQWQYTSPGLHSNRGHFAPNILVSNCSKVCRVGPVSKCKLPLCQYFLSFYPFTLVHTQLQSNITSPCLYINLISSN